MAIVDPFDTTAKSGEIVDPFATPKAEPKPKSDKRETYSAGDIGKEAGVGTVVGAFAPELMETVGVLGTRYGPSIPGPAGRVITGIGEGALAGGELLRGMGMAGRAKSALAGGLSGATGEIGGQIVEKNYGPGAAAESARILGSAVGPEPFYQLGKLGGSAISSLIPGGRAAKTLGQLMQEGGIAETNFSEAQRKFLEQKLQDIRGGKTSSLQAQKDIADYLKKGAQDVTQTAEQRAAYLEDQAKNVMLLGEAQAGGITRETEKRISNLQSQMNSAADSLRSEANTKAQKIVSDAQQRAQAIRESAARDTPAVRQISEKDANSLIEKARAEADAVLKQANDRSVKLRQTSERLRQTGGARQEAAKTELTKVGEAQTPTKVGKSIRESVEPVVNRLKETRAKNAEKYKGEAFGAASAKEQSGEFAKNTQAWQDAIKELDRLIGVTTLDAIKNPIKQVRQALDPQFVTESGVVGGRPATFESLEQLRRFLRDRAYGLPAEGFDAINQQQAGKLADLVENIQREFSPQIGKFLEQYRIDSKPLNDFKTRLGEAVVGKEEFDMGRFVTDPAELGSKFFKSETGVKNLMALLGGDAAKAEQIARSFTADKLRNADAKAVRQYLDDSRDWIGQFPRLNQELNAAATEMATAEKVGGKRAKLADVLRTEMRSLPIKTQTTMTRAEQDAEKAAARRLQAGEKEAQGITTAAEKQAGAVETAAEREARMTQKEIERQIGASAKSVERQAGKLSTEAEKQAGKVVGEAETQAGQLTKEAQAVRDRAAQTAKLITSGDKSGAARVRDLIFSQNEKELAETSRIILGTPGGREKFAEAVGQVISERAASSLKGAINDWRYVSDNLVSNGLLDAKQAEQITKKLNDIFVTPVSLAQKTTMLQRAIRGAIVGETSQEVRRGFGL